MPFWERSPVGGRDLVAQLEPLTAPTHLSPVPPAPALAGFDAFLGVLRVAFFGVATVLAAVAAVDWLVRTRRLNPFGGVARFFRRTVDPLLVPIERRVLRAGGLPSSAPWWALAAVIIAGIVLLSLLGFLRNQYLGALFAAEAGPRGMVRLLVAWTFGVLQIAILVRVVASWIPVNPYSPWLRWAFVISEPILRPLRGIIPTIGMIDITPIVAWFGLRILQSLLLSLL